MLRRCRTEASHHLSMEARQEPLPPIDGGGGTQLDIDGLHEEYDLPHDRSRRVRPEGCVKQRSLVLFGVLDVDEHYEAENHKPSKDKNHKLHGSLLNLME